MSVSLKINGKAVQVDSDPETPLLWVLRENMGLNGTKFGCGVAQCGACMVHFNGEPVPSCQLTLGAAADGDILTIEGLGPDGSHPVQKAWIENDVPQCGYCQSGMIMSAVALLKRIPKPTEADINENITNICRCGTYVRIRKAILQAAEEA